MTIDEAFSYLDQVKDNFPNQREKYITFLVVLIEFMRKRFATTIRLLLIFTNLYSYLMIYLELSLVSSYRIDIVGVIEKAKYLFKGHPSLLLGLNPFLPKCYEIILNDEDEETYLMQQVFNFMKKTEVTYMLLYDFNNNVYIFIN